MPTQTKFPGSNATITTGWTTPNNAHADDGSYTTCAPGKSASVVTDYYNFGFTIPTGSTINSITFETQYKSSTTSSTGATLTLQPILNTTLRGTAITGNMNLADTTINGTTAGTWSVSEINDNTQAGGMKLRLSGKRASSNTAITWSDDYVKVTVDYTEPTYNFSGSFSISAAGSVTATGKKKSSASASVAQASTVSISGVKYTFDKVGSFAISQTSTVASTGKKSTRSVFSIANDETVTLVGSKVSTGILSVAQASSISATCEKETLGILAISQPTSITATGDKYGGLIAYTGEFQIAQNTGISTGGRKSSFSSIDISQVGSVAFGAVKSTHSALAITQETQITTAGVKASETYTFVGLFGIVCGGLVNAVGKHQSRGAFLIPSVPSITTSGYFDTNLVVWDSAVIEYGNVLSGLAAYGNTSSAVVELESNSLFTAYGNTAREIIEYDPN